MPVFETTTWLASPVEAVFDFLARPANLARVSPPDLHLQLVDGPERLELGARITVKGRRWGVPQRVVSEVTAFEPPTLLADAQREGPFGKWVHTHRLEAVPGGTRMVDRIEFAPPGGLLGLVVSRGQIESDLEWVFAYRTRRFHEIFGELSKGEGP